LKKLFLKVSTLVFSSKHSHFLWSVSILAFIIRLAIILYAGNPQHPEMYEHGAIAHNLYTGHGFAMHWPYESLDSARVALMKEPPRYESAYQPPLNPYLIYATYSIFGENSSAIIFLMLFYALISTLIPLVVFKTGMQISSERTSRISSLISAFFFPAAFAVVTFSGSPLYQLFGLIILYLSITAAQRPSLKVFLSLGIICGLMTLLRSEFLILSLFLIVASLYFLRKKIPIRNIASYGAISFFAFASIIAPWAIRNYNLFQKFVPIVDRPWHEIWRGNNIHSTVSSFDQSGKPIWIHASLFPTIVAAMDSIPYDQYFTIRVDSIFRKEAIAYIEQHPIHSAALGTEKILSLLTIAYFPGISANPLYFISIIAISIMSVSGMITLMKNRNSVQNGVPTFYLIFFIYYCIIAALTFVLPRYQIYIFSVLLPLTGLGWEKIEGRIKYIIR
jgi:4-amino-4-deoxy-L-arabinose transferase-like glycosyltransferase